MIPKEKEAPTVLTIAAASSQVADADPAISEIGVHGKWAVKLAPLALSVQWMVLSTASFLSLQMTETATLASVGTPGPDPVVTATRETTPPPWIVPMQALTARAAMTNPTPRSQFLVLDIFIFFSLLPYR